MPDFITRLSRNGPAAKPATTLGVKRGLGGSAQRWRPSRQEIADALKLIEQSGLFDAKFYEDSYPDVAEASVNLLQHFFFFGFREGRKPNQVFDPQWYRDAYKDVRDFEIQPLL